MKKILVAYYSLFGTTELASEYLAGKVNGDLLKLIPEEEYSFDYNTAVKKARLDIEKGFCPRLINDDIDISKYDLIFIGGPNWFKSFPPPIMSFIRGHCGAVKEIIPFCTHGGGGLGIMESQIKENWKGSIVSTSIAISPNTITEDIDLWIANNKNKLES